MEDKNSIRKQMKETLSKLSPALYQEYSIKIAAKLFEDPDWERSEIIGITISKRPEVDTYPIIQKAWELGKKVAVPKCHPKEKKLSFRIITEFTELESVFYGLLEPIETETVEVNPEKIDLLIVPGLAYIKEGYRLGFGGGYYDRFLQHYKGKTLSLAFDCQLVTYIPVEEHDIPVSKIITNDDVIKI